MRDRSRYADIFIKTLRELCTAVIHVKILKTCVVSTLLLLIPVALCSLQKVWAKDLRDELWSRVEELFTVIEKAGSEGMDVKELIRDLNKAIQLIRKGDEESLRRAKAILDSLSARVEEISRELPRYRLVRDLCTYSRVALLLSIPVAMYFLLPRAYLRLWYRYRRRWLVEER